MKVFYTIESKVLPELKCHIVPLNSVLVRMSEVEWLKTENHRHLNNHITAKSKSLDAEESAFLNTGTEIKVGSFPERPLSQP